MASETRCWGAEEVFRKEGCVRYRVEGAIARTLRAGAAIYERARDLPRLARLDPRELTAETVEGAEAILARLERALRAERNRARSGHWTYDLNRHIALRQAYLAETERLRALRKREPGRDDPRPNALA
jgi:hypothetical protein